MPIGQHRMAIVFLPWEDAGEAYVDYVVTGKRRPKPVRHLRMGLPRFGATRLVLSGGVLVRRA